ncbi:hypothetical protein Cgig2_030793 [Carnegiea gigantea]|uniref:Uncharacterized protein n=1 Tax=Carnegiea gigantea TaxID=171969 RepID=A0A9Q1KUM7_9CARY|nr:hypothetical protein Cgig2_030793 [Carnegiea gigantea]
MRRFVHCRNYGGGGGCEYFEWVDESLDETVRSMVVGLMVTNDTIAVEIKRLENDLEAQKHEVKKLKEKNRRMKLKLYAWQRTQKLYLFFVIMFTLLVAMYIGFFLEGCTICLCTIVAAVPPLFATVCPACVVATVNGVKTVTLSCAGSIGSDLIH